MPSSFLRFLTEHRDEQVVVRGGHFLGLAGLAVGVHGGVDDWLSSSDSSSGKSGDSVPAIGIKDESREFRGAGMGQDHLAQPTRLLGIVQEHALGQQIDIEISLGQKGADQGALAGLARPE